MTKKLFTVSLDVEAVVAAESKEEAKQVAYDNWREIQKGTLQSPEDWTCCREGNWWLPADWENDSVPYGEDGDKTIAEYAAEEKARRAAPALQVDPPYDRGSEER